MAKKVKSFLVTQRQRLLEQRLNRKDDEKDRLEILKERIKNFIDSEDIMMEIIDIFSDIDVVPTPGKYYTFIYNAKTKNLIYDQHPLVAVTNVYNWGFDGINFHWNKMRRYTWEEVAGYLHVVYNNEIFEMKNINYAKYLSK